MIPRLILTLAAILSLAACGQRPPYSDLDPPAGGGAGIEPVTMSVFGAEVSDTVLFLVNEAALTDAAQATLLQQARYFSANPTATAVIEGHADERGTREYNLALGAARAGAVREFLVLNGVADNRLSTVTYGKERPLEICTEEACYARNRRAQTVVTGGLVNAAGS